MSKGKPDRFVESRDGRRLAVDEMGSEDGVSLIVCHGAPGSRLLPWVAERVVRERGLRLIGIDRPGFGFSDPHPGRTILGWAADVADVADELGIGRFHVVGFSSGSPFALACARALPERVAGTALVGGVTPHDDRSLVTDVLAPLGVAGRALLRLPGGWHAVHSALAFGTRKDPQRTLERIRAMVAGEAERAFLSGPGGEELAATIVEGVRPGARGWADETALVRRPWGFAPEDVTGRIAVWHSIHDETVPIEHARQLADALPDGQLYATDDGGHISLGFLVFDAIVDSLLESPARAQTG